MTLKPFFTHEHPIRLAHRGSRVLWPENTMEAFQAAVDLGYRYIETDIRATRDGVLIVFHDRNLDRLTDGSGPVRDRYGSQLSGLDAAHHFAPERDYPMRGSGHRIPTLEEVVSTFPELMLNLDLKGAGVARLLPDFIKRHSIAHRVLMAGFFDSRLALARRLAGPEVATSAGSAEAAAFLAAATAGRALRIGADALQVPPRQGRLTVVNRRFVAAAHKVGKQIHVWTVNQQAEMRRLLTLGVDGIVTDRPDLLNEVLGV